MNSGWQQRHQFVLRRDGDGDTCAGLAVYKWRSAANTEHDRSLSTRPQPLAEHQAWAADKARAIAVALGLPDRYRKILTIAARLHDEGKQVERWQRAFNAEQAGRPYAKTSGPVNVALLDGYRHELGSLFYPEEDSDLKELPPEDQELALHLIAAHHSNARPTIRTSGCDLAPPSQLTERSRQIADALPRCNAVGDLGDSPGGRHYCAPPISKRRKILR